MNVGGAAAAVAALRAVIEDPTVTSINRQPMRTPGAPHADAVSARAGDGTSPWWESLDGTWDFRLLRGLAELEAAVAQGDPDGLLAARPSGTPRGDWDRIIVPGAWTTQRDRTGQRYVQPHYTNVVMPFDLDPPMVPQANPVGIHRTVVTVPRQWRGRRIVLHLGAAESAAVVLVDGRFVGASTDSRLPAEFDLTPFVRAGRRCTLTVVVARWCAATWVEDQDQWWHGGLQRSVSWYSTASSFLADVVAVPGLVGDTGTLEVDTRVAGAATREPGWTVEVAVEAIGGRRRRPLATTGRLELGVWDASSEAAQVLSGMFTEPGTVRSVLEVEGVRPWSHEDPHLYRVLTTLRDPSGTVVEVRSGRTGFRRVEVRDGQLLINGRPVLLHGVNLHEHDPASGREVPESLTRRDLELMKAHNINAVRAAHYPHDEHLARLCDELGLYLVDEANVESHARQVSLCHDPRYTTTILERVRRMVERDRNHPSIIVWSLGNEAGDAPVHRSAAEWVRATDPSRPVQYEGPLMHDLFAQAPATDIVCPMYRSVEEVVEWSRIRSDDRRPLILCEYSHAMGNSNGSLADYWEAFETHDGLQGGFIWEWLEHGLHRDGPDGEPLRAIGPSGRTAWGYGGDFGDEPHDGNFICDGLVSAEREPHPAMDEVRWVGRPVGVDWSGGKRPRLRVTNRRWFSGIEDLEGRWQVLVDGEQVAAGVLEVPAIAPRSSTTIAVPHRPTGVPEGAEVHLRVSWRLRRATAWAPAGTELAHDQVELPVARRVAAGAALPATAAATAAGTGASRDGVSSVGEPIGEIAWRPTVFRALTDNDGIRVGWMRGLAGNFDRWIDQQGLDRCEWDPIDGVLRPGSTDLPPIPVSRTVEAHDDGWAHVRIRVDLPEELGDPPRVGTEWDLPTAVDHVEWFGDGPHENYPDRNASALVGRWRRRVEDMYEDYVLPQEHGSRGGLRWAVLSTTAGRASARSALVVVVDPSVGAGTLAFAVREFDDAALWGARHTDDLHRDSGHTSLYLDIAQRGLGTASCGPDAAERYRIAAGRHEMAVWMRWVDPSRVDPVRVATHRRRSLVASARAPRGRR